jgi:hypothetical protein
MLKSQLVAGGIKVSMKLAAVIRLDVIDLAIEQIIEPLKEVLGRSRAVGFIHSRKSDFGMAVDRGEDVAFLSIPITDDCVHTN